MDLPLSKIRGQLHNLGFDILARRAREKSVMSFGGMEWRISLKVPLHTVQLKSQVALLRHLDSTSSFCYRTSHNSSRIDPRSADLYWPKQRFPPMNRKTAAMALVITVFPSFAATARADDQLYDWHNVRIIGAKVTGIAFHPTASDDLYVRTATSGAIAGTRHQILDLHHRLGRLPRLELRRHREHSPRPLRPDRVYLAVGTYTNDWAIHGAMLRSTDRGVTWQVAHHLQNGRQRSRRNNDGERPLVVDPNNGKILFFGSRQNGLWKSIDSGTTWTRVATLPVTDQTDGIGITFVTFQQQPGLKAENPRPSFSSAVSSSSAAIYQSKDAGANLGPRPQSTHRPPSPSRRLGQPINSFTSPTALTPTPPKTLPAPSGNWTSIPALDRHHAPPSQLRRSLRLRRHHRRPQHPTTLMASTLGRKKKATTFSAAPTAGKTWTRSAPPPSATLPRPLARRGQMHAPFGPSIATVAIDPLTQTMSSAPRPGDLNAPISPNSTASGPTHWAIGSIGIEGFSALQVISPAERRDHPLHRQTP